MLFTSDFLFNVQLRIYIRFLRIVQLILLSKLVIYMYLYYVTSNYDEQVRNLYRVTVFETFGYIIYSKIF